MNKHLKSEDIIGITSADLFPEQEITTRFPKYNEPTTKIHVIAVVKDNMVDETSFTPSKYYSSIDDYTLIVYRCWNQYKKHWFHDLMYLADLKFFASMDLEFKQHGK